jgi:polynucleotide 5'-kinase involved in rRNA processing
MKFEIIDSTLNDIRVQADFGKQNEELKRTAEVLLQKKFEKDMNIEDEDVEGMIFIINSISNMKLFKDCLEHDRGCFRRCVNHVGDLYRHNARKYNPVYC